MKRIDVVTRNYARRIASTLPLAKGVCLTDVLSQIWPAIEQMWDRHEQHESRYGIESVESENALLLTPRRHQGKGRPPKAAMRGYVTDLATIYERSTGNSIRRKVDAYAERDAEKAHPFLAICIKAASFGSIAEDDMSYPRLIIRQVLQCRKTR